MLTLEDGDLLEVDANHPRGGLALTFDLAGDASLQLSPVWNTAGWQCLFFYLAPHQSLCLPRGSHLLKVITGAEVNTKRSCFAGDAEVRSTRLPEPASDDPGGSVLVAGASGLLAALFTETVAVKANIHDMAEVNFSGPQSHCLMWRSFKDRFGAVTPYFDDLDNHMADGFHLRDVSAGDICYVNFWTCGLGGDVSTHNHAHPPAEMNPAFAEVHLVLNNAAGESGMYLTQSPDARERQIYRMLRGDEHGPFFHHQDGAPEILDNGAVSYPWHGWESRGSASTGAAFDYVVAFEIYPAFAGLE